MTGIQKGAIGTLLTGGLLGILLVAVVFGGEAALSTEEFCTSCHSMTYTQTELKQSTHYGALGVNPGCRTVIFRKDSRTPLSVIHPCGGWSTELYLELINDYSTLRSLTSGG